MRILLVITSLISSVLLFGQNPLTVTLASPDSGNKNYAAQDKVQLNPGYSYTGTTNKMRAYIEKHTAYQSLFSGATFDATTINTALPVGAIAGEHGVSEGGAAAYSIPIILPSGTNGIVPNLSIDYNSNTGNGVMGIGWNFSGLSAISVVPSTWYQDGKTEGLKLDGTDKFALDGNRLYATTGTYGYDATVYATEAESYMKITSYGWGIGPDWFKVETKDGVTMEFGKTVDSRIKSQNSEATISWRINKVYDTYGNYVEFVYRNENNDSRIDRILFTGNINEGVAPYNVVQFVYKTRNDPNATYIDGSEVEMNYLLSKIEISSDGSPFKSYEFEYGENHYSYLKSITEVGADGTKLNPTIFKYGENYAAFEIGQCTSLTPVDTEYVGTGDYNNDGKSDLLAYHYYYDSGNNQIYTSWEIFVAGNLNEFSHYASGTIPAGYVMHFDHRAMDFMAPGVVRSFDFFGDGADDILMVNVNRTFDEDLGEYLSVLTSVRVIDINGVDNKQEHDLLILSGGFVHDDRFLHTGDFDGDGRDDIVYFKYGGPDNLDHFGKIITATNFAEQHLYLTGLTYLESAVQTYTGDFDGDGKIDLTVLYPTTCEIFEFTKVGNNLTENKIYQSSNPGFPTQYHRIYPADFNGDGKTDILTTGNSGNTWSVAYSDGIQYRETSFAFDATLSMTGGFVNYNFADVNGDGKMDILHSYRLESQPSVYTTYLDVYVSKGIGFVKQQHLLANGTVGITDFVTGDFNGDGKSDVFNREVGGTFIPIYYFNRDGQGHLLSKVKNGFGHVTQFYHTWLAKGFNYVKGTNASWPLTDVQPSIPVVSMISIPNGIGGVSSTYYSYEGVKFHRQGVGFLGFMKKQANDLALGKIATTEFELKIAPNPYLLLLKKENVKLTSTSELLEEVTYTNTLSLTGLRYKVNVTNVVDNNAFATTTTTTSNTFDNNGNLTQSITSNGVVTTTVTNTYGTFGSWWIPSRILTVNVSTTRSGEPAYSRSTNYSYNSLGSLYQEVNFPGTTKSKTSTYLYDDFGNNILKSISATGLATVTNQVSYDNKGRFVLKTINPLNQETIYTYDKRWGKPTTIVNPDGLSASSYYNEFGVMISSTSETGITSTIQTIWNITNGTATPTTPQNTLYYVKSESLGRPYEILRYDLLGRVVQEDVEGLNGIVKKVTNYNSKGQIHTASNPFFTGESPVYVTNSYDVYGRPLTVSNGAATTNYTYSNSNGLATVTVSNPLGTVSKTSDASGAIVSSTDEAGTLTFQYYSSGLEKQTSMGGQVLVSMEYDQYGNQTKIIDKDAGTTLYDYNAFGQLISQTDANGNQYQMTYDVMGRETTSTGPDGVTTTSYITAGNGLNNFKKADGANGVDIENTYDNKGRVLTETQTIDGIPYTTAYEYDNTLDRVTSMTYPSGYKIKYYYDVNNYLTSIKNDAGTITIYSLPEQNASGQYTKYTLGNGKITQKTYDNYGLLTSSVVTGVQNLETGFSNTTGNLLYRRDHLKNRTEEFTYDASNRLTQSKVYITSSGLIMLPIDVNYAANGNILDKTRTGTYSYDANKIHAVVGVTNPENLVSSLQQDITYTPFDRTATITEGTKVLTFTYGPDLNRVKTVLTTSGNTTKTRYFVGAYEKEVTASGTKEIHYIPTGDGANAVYVITNGVGEYNYLYRDHLGSVVAVTNSAGTVVMEQNFDAWGRRRDAITWNYTTSLPSATYSWVRGYTGHEHLDDFGLINMNNRMYDPILGRMLAVDNFVQNPYSTQSYNRYSYSFNNPLVYSDPNGEFVVGAVAAIGILLFTQPGYELQKLVSPIAIHIGVHFGTHQNGIGFDVSFGIPQAFPLSFRGHFGKTLYFNTLAGKSGVETRVGSEVAFSTYIWGFPFAISYSGTTFSGMGYPDQTTHTISIGNPMFSAYYENDTNLELFGAFNPSVPAGDTYADEYRTASAGFRLFGHINVGMTLHTGGDWKGLETGSGTKDDPFVKDGGTVNDPSMRHGILYVGVGPLRIGADTEGIRHGFQNVFAHDVLNGGKYGSEYPYFKTLDKKTRPNRFYFQFSTGSGNTGY